MSTKKIGVIGCGAVTEQFYLKVLPLLEPYSLAYLYDIDSKRSAYIESISTGKSVDFDMLVQNSDVVIICTPPEYHFELIKKVIIGGGKEVISEKPYLFSSKDAQELEELANKNNASIYVAHFRREYPSIRLARNIAISGILGEVQAINISEGGRFNWTATSDYFTENRYGGVTLDTGSHLLDSALYICNLDSKELSGIHMHSLQKDKPEPSHEIKANLNLAFQHQAIDLRIRLSRFEILSNEIVIHFTHGQMILPSYLSNYVRLISNHGGVTVYADKKYATNQDAFLNQYKRILNWQEGSSYKSGNFMNLTKILEIINNG